MQLPKSGADQPSQRNIARFANFAGSQGLTQTPMFQGKVFKTSEFWREIGSVNPFVLDAVLRCDSGSGPDQMLLFCI